VKPPRRAVNILAAAALAAIFVWFTWRDLTMFFSGDDMMNMYGAWNVNPWRLARAQFMIWLPVYRPLGGAVYRIFYAVFGFHPLPLYVFCWLMLAVNAVLAYRFFRELTGAAMLAFLALSLTLVHGNFQDLYTSAGTIYDRLWFLFTVLGIAVYARMRRKGGSVSWRDGLLVCAICVLSMDSKESGVALPVLLGCYELVFVLPGKAFRTWLREMWPLYLALAVLCAVFVFLRVDRTFELTVVSAYQPHFSPGLWLNHVGEYFSILSYRHVPFSGLTAGLVLAAMALAAGLLRSRAMIFGWLFFVITITPVALIASRPGYVLYVPELGLGLFIAGLVGAWGRAGASAYPTFAFVAITLAVTWFHLHNWPAPFDQRLSPEYRLTEQFRRNYPKMPSGSNLLFVKDEFPRDAFDLLFNLRLMYHDRSINAYRMDGPPDQQPDRKRPVTYDHVFTSDPGYYLELDNRNPDESIRLHILKDYTVGREMDIARRDHAAYVVSGVMDGDNPDPSRWTTPQTRLKFDLYPAPAVFSAKFWVPDFVAKTAARTMTVSVNGKQVGSLALSHDGMNEIAFPVPAEQITLNGYTIVDMDVANPWKDPAGIQYGVVLLRAGFEYLPHPDRP
jgi:hypothetical protein